MRPIVPKPEWQSMHLVALGVWNDAKSTGCADRDCWKKVDSGCEWQDAQKLSCDSWVKANVNPPAVSRTANTASIPSSGRKATRFGRGRALLVWLLMPVEGLFWI
jgi:hypothetical protein